MELLCACIENRQVYPFTLLVTLIMLYLNRDVWWENPIQDLKMQRTESVEDVALRLYGESYRYVRGVGSRVQSATRKTVISREKMAQPCFTVFRSCTKYLSTSCSLLYPLMCYNVHYGHGSMYYAS